MEHYKIIEAIDMASDSEIERTYTSCLLATGGTEDDLPRTKSSALEWSVDAPVYGFGKNSGKKLWQLPQAVKRNLSSSLKPCQCLS